MLNKKAFADMRRAGMGIEVSKTKLVQAMLGILNQIPMGTTRLKETVETHLGLLGQMSSSRDINSAWNDVKKLAVREYPDKFILDARKTLHWNDGSVIKLDRDISTPNIKKLNELATREGCTVNAFISKLLRNYKASAK